ncbi:MAG: hypothetical protein ACREFF_15025 [Candidatus Udaeobacter sp.]
MFPEGLYNKPLTGFFSSLACCADLSGDTTLGRRVQSAKKLLAANENNRKAERDVVAGIGDAGFVHYQQIRARKLAMSGRRHPAFLSLPGSPTPATATPR